MAFCTRSVKSLWGLVQNAATTRTAQILKNRPAWPALSQSFSVENAQPTPAVSTSLESHTAIQTGPARNAEATFNALIHINRDVKKACANRARELKTALIIPWGNFTA